MTDHARVQQVVVDLVNSAPHGSQGERMGTVAQLSELATGWIVTEAEPPTAADVQRLHRFRIQLRGVFTAPNLEGRIEIVNQLLASANIHPRLVEHDGLVLHIHYFVAYAPLSEHLIADCSMALALMFERGEGHRLRECAAPGCGTVFIDRSKNRSRLYCDSKGCGNRLHAAAYRARTVKAS